MIHEMTLWPMCRNCGNTGYDMFHRLCKCKMGRALAQMAEAGLGNAPFPVDYGSKPSQDDLVAAVEGAEVSQADERSPLDETRLAEIRAILADEHGMGDIPKRLQSDWMSIRFSAQVAQAGLDLLAEVERLRAREAEWDSKEQALQKSITEHERVIARIEARYEQQGQYNHQLVRRLLGALEIARAVAEAPIEVGTVNKTSVRFLLLRSDVRRVQEQARALLAQDEEQETSQ